MAIGVFGKVNEARRTRKARPEEQWCDICYYELGDAEDRRGLPYAQETHYVEEDGIWAHQTCLDEKEEFLELAYSINANAFEIEAVAEQMGINLVKNRKDTK